MNLNSTTLSLPKQQIEQLNKEPCNVKCVYTITVFSKNTTHSIRVAFDLPIIGISNLTTFLDHPHLPLISKYISINLPTIKYSLCFIDRCSPIFEDRCSVCYINDIFEQLHYSIIFLQYYWS